MGVARRTVEDRLRIIREAETCGVSSVCDAHGISRTLFYRWKKRFGQDGPAGLNDRPPVPRSHPSQTPGELRDLILTRSLCHPAAGSRIVARMVGKEGHAVSAVTVNKLLRDADLQTRRARWLALESALFRDGRKLSAKQLAFIESCNPNIRDRAFSSCGTNRVLCAGEIRVLSPTHRQLATITVVIDAWSGYAQACAQRLSGAPHADDLLMQMAACQAIDRKVSLVVAQGSILHHYSKTAQFLRVHKIAVRTVAARSLGFVESFRRALGRDSGEALATVPPALGSPPRADEALARWLSHRNETPYAGFPNFGRSPAAMHAEACKQGSLTNPF